jgi:putative membrane protein
VLHRRLSRDELRIAAAFFHYAFGAAVGAIYGAYVESRSRQRSRSGAGLGTALWATADEMAMPMLGLSERSTRRPLEMHLQSFAAHLVYGVTTEVVRRPARMAL